ncbi:MAG: sigma 54-interacting transcriptional regulator [Candidatus Riflebacteria bacterium]|nr:sigma 54-interacting transcriptional regulator [Candidatus Riflebacteria bacterium]
MKNVVIGFLGTTLDRRGKDSRWERWRPTVAVCQHENLLINRFHLLHNARDLSLAEQIREDITAISPETEVILDRIEFKNPWDFEEVFSGLLDYSHGFHFDRENEEYLLHITTGTHVSQICMFLLTEAGFFPGKLLQTGPGRGNTPPGSFEIIDLDLSRYDSIARRFAQQTHDDISFLKSGIQTRNQDFNRLISEVEKVTLRSSAPMLLMGPTGAGKSRLAQQIYALKKQHNMVSGQLVEVNCAMLRGDMALSVLFGHRKGAFTGATENRPGLLQTANKGILFLDEIGELGSDEQSMLLRAIEEKRYLPVGSDQEVESDFQLICGTNRDLKADVKKGGFREDLFARIKFWSFRLPGLTERIEDIEPNIVFELQNRSREAGKAVIFSSEARTAYLKFAVSSEARWPGNFRDLNTSISRMAILAEGHRICMDDVKNEITRLESEWTSEDTRENYSDSPMTEITSLIGRQASSSLDLFDRIQLAEVIKICRKCKSLAEAGRKLFSESRKQRGKVNDSDRLRKYLQRFDLTWDMVSKLIIDD